jgi:hypothetical protein
MLKVVVRGWRRRSRGSGLRRDRDEWHDDGVDVARGELRDWYVDGEESAVFVGDQVMVLSAAATAILTEVGDATASTDRLAAVLVAKFGEPEGSPQELVQGVVEDLVNAGVLMVLPEPPG